MKAVIVFTSLVLGYSIINVVQLKVGASTYKQGLESYMSKHQNKINRMVYEIEHEVARKPAIVSNKE